MLLRVSPGCYMRNVYYLFGYYVFLGSYNKTSSMSFRESVAARVPYSSVGKLLINFDVLIRPAVVHILTALGKPDEARHAKFNLYFRVRGQLDSVFLSRSLAKETKRLLGVELPISKFRQFINWFTTLHAERFPPVGIITNMAHVQAGHTGFTSSGSYANHVLIPNGIHLEVLRGTMFASGQWQDLIGLNPNLKNTFLSRQQIGDKVVATNSINVSELARAMFPAVQTIGSQVNHFLGNALKENIAEVVATQLLPKSSPRSSSCIVHPSRLAALKAFVNDPSATWRSTEQAQATELIIERKSHLFVILPTGMYLLAFFFAV
jgi:hypothetical protein